MAIELVLDASVSIARFLNSARRVMGLARRYHLHGCDALYFELARTLGLPSRRS